MKKIGLVILLVGILLAVVTGISYVTKEKVIDIGEIQVSRDKDHDVAWSPLLGLGLIVVGGVMYGVGVKKD